MSANYIKTDDHIFITFDDDTFNTVYHTQPNFDPLCEAVKEENWDVAKHIAFLDTDIRTDILNTNGAEIKDGIVYYRGQSIDNSLTTRLVQMHSAGFNITHMLLFLEHLMQNPSHRAVNELYGFLEESNLPITDDGYFIAYKRVSDNYTDIYTGKMDNSPGAIVEMERNAVDEDKNQTCSVGLHFCSRAYLPKYGTQQASTVMVIKINPRDVVSIPTDYNHSKGRCCRYEVIRELQCDLPQQMPEETLESAFVISDQLQIKVIKVSLDGKVVGQYPSVRMAAELSNLDASNIRKVCDGKRKSAGGFVWQWAKDAPTLEQRLQDLFYDNDDYDYDGDDYFVGDVED